ncbi:hypothetical protein MP228_008060 [Amoeboaphelidium protococcarum]|nr:hypothetical protein MP228_008060 [Amoeboaphelidium protococcarum]
MASQTEFTFNGFLAGILSGITKLFVGQPFDTIKVRMQTQTGAFNSSTLNAARQTLIKEGLRGFYKGSSPPLFGWILMDSVGLGSLENYRRMLRQYNINNGHRKDSSLTYLQHGIAGTLSGLTVTFVATPIELLKAQMQIQYSSDTTIYRSPLHCAQYILKNDGIFGMWRGLSGNFLFRGQFYFLWSSYQFYYDWIKQYEFVSSQFIPLICGGLSANTFWCIAFPADVIKNRMMCADLRQRRYLTLVEVAKQVYISGGVKAFYRGFLPCILRSFPTNGAALYVYHLVFNTLEQQ